MKNEPDAMDLLIGVIVSLVKVVIYGAISIALIFD